MGVEKSETAGGAFWHCLGHMADRAIGPSADRLLGVDLVIENDGAGGVSARRADDGRAVETALRYDYLWAAFETPAGPPPDIPEALEPDRRVVPCGSVLVRASGLRIVENFLDMAHFPFVHTDILGTEEHPEVVDYRSEIRRDVDEVWATECRFVQPKAAMSAEGAITTQYMYRVATPFVTLLYKTCPNAANRWDVIGLFVQPLDETRCRAHPVMYLLDDETRQTDLIHFQQVIFLQDRIILENQRPRLLPLEPRAEIPTRADGSSIAYRRWLKEKGVSYGASTGAEPAAP